MVANEIYSLTFKGKTSGFFVARELENRILFASIGGIYPKFQGFGLGLGLNYQEIILAKNLNLRIENWAYEKLDETKRVSVYIKDKINKYDFS